MSLESELGSASVREASRTFRSARGGQGSPGSRLARAGASLAAAVCPTRHGRGHTRAVPGWSHPVPALRAIASMCTSDRKRFMVLQVKTMSSHHRAAGTRHMEEEIRSVDPSTTYLDRDRALHSRHTRDSTRPSTSSAAQMPNACPAPVRSTSVPGQGPGTGSATAENGFAIRIELMVTAQARARAPRATAASRTAPRARRLSRSAAGARPSSTKAAYVWLRRPIRSASIEHPICESLGFECMPWSRTKPLWCTSVLSRERLRVSDSCQIRLTIVGPSRASDSSESRTAHDDRDDHR